MRGASGLARLIATTVSGSGWKLLWARRILRHWVSDRYAAEILKNLRFSPHDKVALEHAKCLIAAQRDEEAEAVLFRITRRLNADWRSVYRAFCLLTWLYRDRGDMARARRYEDLCRIANPQFPEAFLGGSAALFRSWQDSVAATER